MHAEETGGETLVYCGKEHRHHRSAGIYPPVGNRPLDGVPVRVEFVRFVVPVAIDLLADGNDEMSRRPRYPRVESRSDVLELLEDTDHILNACESAIWQFAIEKPDISDAVANEFIKLVDTVAEAVEALVAALRGFFHGDATLSDHMHKVIFYESEADKISHRVMGMIFEGDGDLSLKNQLRHFVLHIDNIADIAEDVADKLAIFALKRAI